MQTLKFPDLLERMRREAAALCLFSTLLAVSSAPLTAGTELPSHSSPHRTANDSAPQHPEPAPSGPVTGLSKTRSRSWKNPGPGPVHSPLFKIPTKALWLKLQFKLKLHFHYLQVSELTFFVMLSNSVWCIKHPFFPDWVCTLWFSYNSLPAHYWLFKAPAVKYEDPGTLRVYVWSLCKDYFS